MAKLSPRYCGPSTIYKCIGKVAYKSTLSEFLQVHTVFDDGRSRKQLGQSDNIGTHVLVNIIEPLGVPHEQEIIFLMSLALR